MKTLTKIIYAVLIYYVLFVIACFVTYWVKDGVPDALIPYALGGGVIELVVGGLIEIFKKKFEKDNNLIGGSDDDSSTVCSSICAPDNSERPSDTSNEDVPR